MVSRSDIVKEARSWIGTRYQHQASLKYVACDCIGLVRGVGLACGLYPSGWADLPEVRAFAGYGRHASEWQMREGCDLFATRINIAEASPGDFVLLRVHGAVQHAGILGDTSSNGLSLIHAYAGARGVVENEMGADLFACIVYAYAFPRVE